MRAGPTVAAVAMAVAVTTAAATATAAASPPAAAAAVAVAASRPLSAFLPPAGGEAAAPVASAVCVTQADLNHMGAVTAAAMADLGVPPPLLDRWVRAMTVRMPTELGTPDDPAAHPAVVDGRVPVDGSGGGGRNDSDDADDGVDDRPAGAPAGGAAAAAPDDAGDDRRCYVSDDVVEFVVSEFEAILDEAQVSAEPEATPAAPAAAAATAAPAAAAAAAAAAARVALTASLRRAGVCRTCCALLAFDARFHRIIRRCACHRCRCRFDCR